MIRFDKALCAWGTSEFEAILKEEIIKLGQQQLPLQQGLSVSSTVTDDPITVLIQRVTEMDYLIRVRAGIFYQGMIGGCSCAGDPTPDSTNNEYCEVQLEIDKTTAITSVVLVDAAS